MKAPKTRFCLILFTAILIVTGLLTGCSPTTKVSKKKKDGPPKHVPAHLLRTPDAIPKVEPLSRYGNRFNKGKSDSYVALNRRYRVMSSSRGYRARGIASWYGTQFHGRKTSNGERYNMFAMTAAHRSLPLPTYVKVTNLENGKSVVVRVTDRGPFHKDRIIDLSYVAAAKLGILGRGTGKVEVESIDPRDHGGLTQKYKHVPSKNRSRSTRTRIASNKKISHSKASKGRVRNIRSATVERK